jgi:hypothetical protein
MQCCDTYPIRRVMSMKVTFRLKNQLKMIRKLATRSSWRMIGKISCMINYSAGNRE